MKKRNKDYAKNKDKTVINNSSKPEKNNKSIDDIETLNKLHSLYLYGDLMLDKNILYKMNYLNINENDNIYSQPKEIQFIIDYKYSERQIDKKELYL